MSETERQIVAWLRKRKKAFTLGAEECNARGAWRDRDMLIAAEGLIADFANAIERGEHKEGDDEKN